eukprot:CAMPEP_0194052478 /NCGR_PEP_ID=MMETSP0009_2-20130614/45636_1 /TAXON_ID=210454 /ORGANISM="Grammatophora oceanica, Strain CCMP 410" /LENGTH=95 /DNA_ID=CAMNT_0038700083 /DNA_START=89 /DNA_END=373 /DNA_ORIENTATION=+
MTDLVKPVYHPGPLPKSSRIPYSAQYSGLIECPCSDRVEKIWNMTYTIDPSSCRDGAIENASECLTAAKNVVLSNHYELISNNSSDDAAANSDLG